jgi:uncharacterized protein
MEANMNYKQKKKIFNVALVLALILSLITPFQNFSKAADVIKVADAIANNTGTATVEGYIVGYYTATNAFTTDPTKFKDDTNLAIADSIDETDPTKVLPVQLTNTANFRTDFGLKTNPGNVGKKVQISGTLVAYFSVPGLKTPTAMTFVGSTAPETKVAEVTATPAAGAVEADTKVALATTTVGAKIYYTTDGTVPTASSTEYTAPITIEAAKTIKALAIKNGLDNSNVATFAYTILTESTVAQVRAMKIDSNVQTSGIVTAVLGRAIYFQDATAGLVAYTPPTSTTVKPGDVITVKGKLVEFSGLLEIEATHENIVVTGTAPIPAAELLPAAGFQESKEGMLVKVRNVTINSL